MKKKIKLMTVAALAAMAFESCQKCTTCKVTHKNTGIVMAEDGKYCGTKQDIKDYKDGLNSSYSSADYSINCSDN